MNGEIVDQTGGLPLFTDPPLPTEPPMPHFNGPDYEPKKDHFRLSGQLLRVWGAMYDGRWRTLGEIAQLTGDPEASISAQLRHLRKPRFGAHVVEKRRKGSEKSGLWEYLLVPSEGANVVEVE